MSALRPLLLAVLLWPAAAQARVERYAVVVGNNRGHAHEAALRYAESDAVRVFDVLRELGGFEPVNMVLLRDEGVDTVRRTLIAINDRIREAITEPDTQAVLFVYYSGHADAERLHLGATSFELAELAQLVRGSPATFRVIVLDSCRSGALTRLKGGRRVPPFELPEERLRGAGMAYLAASAEGEDAQESDQLRGSFFTHALVSGLLGAADRDGNGEVVLDEAYRYAYESTLRATSRTLAGTQHPTFRFDVRGQGDLVLTRPDARSAQRTRLHFPSGLGVLLLRDHAEGPVVAELAADSSARLLSVRPGRYFVRARGPDVLYEGTLLAAPGTSADVDVSGMQRIEYARLVRKGGRASRIAHGPEGGLRVRTPLPNSGSACIGGFAGYAVDLADLGVAGRVSGCSGGFDSGMLHATTSSFDVELRLYRAWDVSALSFALGLGGGAALFTQSFRTRGSAPSRQSLFPFLALSAGASLELGSGLYASLDVAAETYFMRIQATATDEPSARASVAVRPSLGVAKRF